MSLPPKRMLPRRGWMMPESVLFKVDLPAPLLPSNATIWPSSIARSTPCSTSMLS
jgi:hypothetical protein